MNLPLRRIKNILWEDIYLGGVADGIAGTRDTFEAAL
jgi:hypothetical protein